ncbi:MAG: hypothetical protein EZS28_039361 [Streblomastix strix]|uniref:Uncharacterized protein n=1 Tax=Streblomastix strix TaxID=222440 RepID=A0A5J4U4A2_9EUKA|nr:MAG: hypothetical protein EZS28_039361 [Streblomastix strix]
MDTEKDCTELPLLQIETHEGAILSIQSHKGCLISTSRDKTCRIWDLVTGQLKCTLGGHSSWVNKVDISDDYIVTGSYDGSINVWTNNYEIVQEKDLEPIFSIEGRIDSPQVFYLMKIPQDDKKQFLIVVSKPYEMNSNSEGLNNSEIVVANEIQIWDLQKRRMINAFDRLTPTITCSNFIVQDQQILFCMGCISGSVMEDQSLNIQLEQKIAGLEV